MKREWNEKSAIKALGYGVTINGKLISTKTGLSGLMACSAKDFLVNHCGYKYLSTIVNKDIEKTAPKKNNNNKRQNENIQETTYTLYSHIPARARITDIIMAKAERGDYAAKRFLDDMFGVAVV